MREEARTELYYGYGSSDKVYTVSLVCDEKTCMYRVNISYGRRGAYPEKYSKPDEPTTYPKARKIYDRTVKSKTAKGYEVTRSFDLHEEPVS